MASTEPEQPLDPAGQTPSVDPSITPSTPHRHKAGVSAGQARRKGGRCSADNPHIDVARKPQHRRTSTEPRRRELLQALGIFQRATPDQLWKLTRPDNQHDKLTRDNLLDLEDHHLVRIESVQEDQRQVWVLTKRGHREAKKLLEPKGIRVSALRKQEYDPDTGALLGTGYDDHAAAVTSTAAELHRAGIGHRLGFQTEIGHRLGSSFVQRADLVVRAPEAGVPVLLVEVDRRTEDAHELVTKLRRYWEWGRLLPKDAAKSKVNLVRSRSDAIEHVDHEKRLWRRFYPLTGREGLVPLAFVFADTTTAKVVNTVAVLEKDGRRYWAPRRYDPLYAKSVTALDYRQAVPVVITTLEQLTEHGAGAAVWRRLGRDGAQTLTDALDNPDGHALYRAQEARAEAEDQRRRAAEREARRPVCSRCGGKFTDERWEEVTVHRTAVRAGDRSVCGPCRADDVARQEAEAEAARRAVAAPPEPEGDPEPARGLGWFRRRT
ncbi:MULTISPECIES: replication-relaxation family protein [unclassified Streptomyces]|uniref:replication-relaxation family protein n=1 Tax=unclassified Streptomyces TaxID=2593676 RepID=UPI001F339A80|nr:MULTISPECIES: replication-relaxation family protein [unclassified Streptomyces]